MTPSSPDSIGRDLPRDPHFALKGGRVLDLYQRDLEEEALGKDEYVLSADEQPGIQARSRVQLPLPPGPRRDEQQEVQESGREHRAAPALRSRRREVTVGWRVLKASGPWRGQRVSLPLAEPLV